MIERHLRKVENSSYKIDPIALVSTSPLLLSPCEQL